MPMFEDYKASRSHTLVMSSFWHSQKWVPTLQHMQKEILYVATRLTGLLYMLSKQEVCLFDGGDQTKVY